ncbi:helix-turn-helix domain-containing protein [Nocardia asteroides]|uniref:helix-turn-helix domain-containing protein n=1 Tax=Nocardia asteroides TaxID=1824 RepID=UPI0037C56913
MAANSGGNIDEVEEGLGPIMRARREDMGLSRKDLAAKLRVSPSALAQWEQGTKGIDPANLANWLKELNPPYLLMRKIRALATSGLLFDDGEAVGPNVDSAELEAIQSLNVPAYLHQAPQMELLAANDVALEKFPWFVPSDPAAAWPSYMIEQLLVDPRAKQCLLNWDEVVHRLVWVLRSTAAGGFIPEDQLQAIVDACWVAPEFEQMWTEPFPEHLIEGNHLRVRNLQTGAEEDWSMWSHNPVHPRSGDRRVLLLITPRS